MNGYVIGAFATVFLAAALVYLAVADGMPAPSRKRAVYKIIPTLTCTLLALTGALVHGRPYAWFLFLGLGVCTAADWILEFRFIPGMGTFGLGHILYCVAYVLTGHVRSLSLWVFLVLFGVISVLWFFLRKRLDQAPLFLCYAAVLCTMAALASSLNPRMMAGGLLFVLSDVMIGVRMALNIKSRWYGVVIMVTYYAAQFLIALCAW